MNPLTRLSQIAPRKAGLVLRTAVATGDMVWLESFFHAAFAHRRVRGEWFRLADEEVGLFLSIPSADSIDDVPSAVAALYAMNEHGGFQWGEKDDAARVPTRCRDGEVSIQFCMARRLADALDAYLASLPRDKRPTKRAVLETALIDYLTKRGAWPRKPD